MPINNNPQKGIKKIQKTYEARHDVIGQLENDRPFDNQSDAPPCSTCGEIMVRSGACYKCSNCGSTSGCS